MSCKFMVVVLVAVCVHSRLGDIPITITNTTTNTNNNSAISNYNNDFASCVCNQNSGFCDMFCCCDTQCSSDSVASWTNGSVCLPSNFQTDVSINNCQNLSLFGLRSFQSINCIFFDNKNAIGRFYQAPGDNIPSIDKMGQIAAKSTNTISFVGAVYIPNARIYTNNTPPTPIAALFPKSVGGRCVNQPLLIGQQLSYSCYRTLTQSECQQANPTSLNAICKDAACSQTISPSTSIPLASLSGGKICSNFINNIEVTITLSGNNNYVIENVTCTYTTIPNNESINFTSKKVGGYLFTAKVILVKSGATERGGGPGYVPGRTVGLYNGDTLAAYTLKADVISATDGNCLSVATSATASLVFGQPYSVSCKADCATTNYVINSLLNTTAKLYVLRYGDNTIPLTTKDGVLLTYAPRTNPTCVTPAKTTLNFIYSYSGTTSDPQNYIVSAYVTYQEQYIPPTSNVAEFAVNWMYVAPQDISQPVNNQFYRYLSKLMIPIRDVYYRMNYAAHLAAVLLIGVIFCL